MSRSLAGLAALVIAVTAAAYPASAEPTHVVAFQKISALRGDFPGAIDPGDGFGRSLATIGDLDGDGIEDVAAGAPGDDDGGTDRGAVWILFLHADGSVRSAQKISDTQGGFTGVLDDGDAFGNSVAALGDLNGDGVEDLAVGAPYDDDHAPGIDPDDPTNVDHGAIWVLFLNTNGTVKSHQKISVAVGGLPNLHPGRFNDEVAFSLGADLDPATGKLRHLAAGAAGEDDGGIFDRGAVWILTLNTTGTVKTAAKISPTSGNFTGTLEFFDRFGTSAAWLGDMNGDGNSDLAVGAEFDDDGGFDHGAVWILFLEANGTVKSWQKISATEGGLTGLVDQIHKFGFAATSIGDLDGNGTQDLAVGVPGDDDGGTDRGAVWILFLNANGTVKSQSKISAAEGGLPTTLDDWDAFGYDLALIGDVDGDGHDDAAAGVPYDDDGGLDRGAVWILFLDGQGAVRDHAKISDTRGHFYGALDDEDHFGSAVAPVGDLDGNGVPDLAVGARFDDDGGLNHGAVWILFLDADGSVLAHRKVSQGRSGFDAVLADQEWFGYSLAGLGDLDHDGTDDLAVGAVNDLDGGGGNHGAVWIVFLRSDGRVKSYQKISATAGGFTGVIDQADDFGRSVAALGDIDGDGVMDIAVGANRDDDGGTDRGAVWIVKLNDDGTVESQQKISDTDGDFSGALQDYQNFGYATAGLGDVDGDGVGDLAVAVPYDGDGGPERGAVWVLFLRASGKVKSSHKISSTMGAFSGPLDDYDEFGLGLGLLGDANGDGRPELGAGAIGDDDGGPNRGAIWVLTLAPDGTVTTERKISDTEGGFEGTLDNGDQFGSAVCLLNDLDGDGNRDLVAGAWLDDDGGSSADADEGAAYVLLLGVTTTTTTPESTTTSTLPPRLCGDATDDGVVTATDALAILRAAVGLYGGCSACVCDVDSSSIVTATDALLTLQLAVDYPVVLHCPPCP